MNLMRNKKFKSYSLKSLLLIAFAIIFLNLSWKTPKADGTVKAKADTVTFVKETPFSFTNFASDIYTDAQLAESNLDLTVFEKALAGFVNLNEQHLLNADKNIITIVDFTKPSTSKRMWIVDLKNKALLLNTYVAHGQGSGENMATNFSNVAESHQSSLGFFIASETYFGKHGLSLKLDGQDKGINDLARNRAIVVHGASYVSEDFIKRTGRLGRSFGCPAVSEKLNAKVIELIKGKTCFFINGKSDSYRSNLLSSNHINENNQTVASL